MDTYKADTLPFLLITPCWGENVEAFNYLLVERASFVLTLLF